MDVHYLNVHIYEVNKESYCCVCVSLVVCFVCYTATDLVAEYAY